MRQLRLLTLVVFVPAIALAAHAQFSLLYNLGTNTADPTFPTWVGNFAQGRDGNLYSTSPTGGTGVYPHVATQVTATVPTGAITGKIKITTPGGTATSASVFTVT